MVTYPTRYRACKEKKYGEVVVKVEGGYASWMPQNIGFGGSKNETVQMHCR